MEKQKVEICIKNYFEDCELRRRLSLKTIKAYRIDLNQFLNIVNFEIEDSKMIISYMYQLNSMYTKYKTIKRKIASVRAFYTFLEFEGLIEVTPFKKIKSNVQEPKLLPKIISNTYIEEILNCVYSNIEEAATLYQTKHSIRNTAIIELLFATGMRISELCHLTKEDINLNDRTLKIFGKGSKERILYIGNDEVIKILKTYRELYRDIINETGFFFVNKFGERLSEQSVRILLNNLEKKLELPIHITPHMFRHTFATMLLEKDVDIRYIQKILGHSSISVTQIYTHVSYPKQKEILTIKNPRNDYKSYTKKLDLKY